MDELFTALLRSAVFCKKRAEKRRKEKLGKKEGGRKKRSRIRPRTKNENGKTRKK